MPKRRATLSILYATVLTTVLFCGSQTIGCRWDRTTLASEELSMPGMIDIIVGRFEREPPRYYSMRLERVAKEIDAYPSRLDLYDDASVACDVLGRHDEAIEWMARKKTELEKRDFLNSKVYEHWYRYHANLGTFYAHRWLKNGARRDNLSDIKHGRDLIAKAIEINPKAHFGREEWQLMAMEWLIELPPAKQPMSMWISLPSTSTLLHMRWDDANETEPDWGSATKGLAGMIAMGNAWESIDIYYALTIALANDQRRVLGLLALNRVEELLENGGESLHPSGPGRDPMASYVASIHEVREYRAINAYFPKAREAAKAWHAHRVAYMESQFDQGRHPDTHSFFWDGYQELDNAPPLPGKETGIVATIDRELEKRHPGSMLMLVTALSLLVVALVIAAVQTVRSQRRRHAT